MFISLIIFWFSSKSATKLSWPVGPVVEKKKSRLIQNDPELKAYHGCKPHLLALLLKGTRLKTEKSLRWHAISGHDNILSAVEYIFTVDRHFNKKNDKVYAKTSKDIKNEVPRVMQGYHSPPVVISSESHIFISGKRGWKPVQGSICKGLKTPYSFKENVESFMLCPQLQSQNYARLAQEGLSMVSQQFKIDLSQYPKPHPLGLQIAFGLW